MINNIELEKDLKEVINNMKEATPFIEKIHEFSIKYDKNNKEKFIQAVKDFDNKQLLLEFESTLNSYFELINKCYKED